MLPDVQLQRQTLQLVHADTCHHALWACAPCGTCHVAHVFMKHTTYGSWTCSKYGQCMDTAWMGNSFVLLPNDKCPFQIAVQYQLVGLRKQARLLQHCSSIIADAVARACRK